MAGSFENRVKSRPTHSVAINEATRFVPINVRVCKILLGANRISDIAELARRKTSAEIPASDFTKSAASFRFTFSRRSAVINFVATGEKAGSVRSFRLGRDMAGNSDPPG